tara:strand:- start:2112 stop:2336 length:225 start_codon:yes stop_codon:yes gene_type:complete
MSVISTIINHKGDIMNKLVLLLGTLFPVLALAHEEHGATLLDNVWHVLASPLHSWPLTLIIILVAVIGVFKARA